MHGSSSQRKKGGSSLELRVLLWYRSTITFVFNYLHIDHHECTSGIIGEIIFLYTDTGKHLFI